MNRHRSVLLCLLLVAAGSGGTLLVRELFVAAGTDRQQGDLVARAEADPAPGPQFFCPMHPGVTSAERGRCPACGMGLEEVLPPSAAPRAAELPSDHSHRAGHSHHSHGQKTAPPGSPVEVDLPLRRSLGMTVAPVRRSDVTRAVRTAGRVASNTELLMAVREYLMAIRTAEEANTHDAREAAEMALGGARTKVRVAGLTEEQIEALTRGKTGEREFAPPTGSVWVYAEIFQYELPLLKIGQEVEASVSYLPGETFAGRISRLNPAFDREARAYLIRAEVWDPGRRLAPDMVLDVEILVPLGKRTLVPSSAVLRTGVRELVFVEGPGGELRPRVVEVGPEIGDDVVLLSGAEEGELVVTGAAFLLDAESRIRSIVASSSEGPGPSEPS